ncbi:hypothetical protein GR183_05415 [Stappia sp. GBMRC 2046]|uniref:Guanylate cyclase domain-containing protein n=1 Tax=Stappia sediminis TaxID=2692190 RepID=A0A7X3S716_9HYPH|nr:adenylate/guanylate cyclase domain-containing protein [Stappia sediminis]MXN64334.1 hypothetical protein [Stappia sediminis]
MNDPSRPTTRRLAAILHADVAGYSALMNSDESATQSAVARSMDRARETVASHGGRLVGTAGDAFLAEFPSVVEAVAAATEFQNAMVEFGASTSFQSPLAFRIGINLGDVIADGDDIFGDGINVAARVQALAPPGGIAITSAVRDQLGRRLPIAFADGGSHSVKNIPDPIQIYVASPPFELRTKAYRRRKYLPHLALGATLGAILALGLAVAALMDSYQAGSPLRGQSSERAENRPVVAILPFKDQTNEQDSYFANGVTEDVISHLGRFSELLVLSWNAVAPFGNRPVDIEALRSDLKARYVVGGSIHRSQEKLRLNVQLTDARDGILMWSRRYETPIEDLFEVQDRITNAIAGSLAVGVGRIEQQRAFETPTEALDAYDLVLRGRSLIRRVERKANFEARKLFRAAIEKDPNYADAHASLAWTQVADVWWGWSEWPANALEEAIKNADRALELDPRNILAMTARSEVLFLQDRLTPSRAQCLRALEINPNDAQARATCGSVMVFSGDFEEGIRNLELSMRIDPDATSWNLTNLAVGYYLVERFEDAANLLGGGARGFDEDPAPHAVLAAANARLGRMEAAQREVEKALRLYPFFDAAIFANNIGNEENSKKLLAGLRAAGFK